MLGNLRLRKADNFLKMAHAKRTTCQQMDYSQPRDVTETLVDVNKFHAYKYSFSHIFVHTNIVNMQ